MPDPSPDEFFADRGFRIEYLHLEELGGHRARRRSHIDLYPRRSLRP